MYLIICNYAWMRTCYLLYIINNQYIMRKISYPTFFWGYRDVYLPCFHPLKQLVRACMLAMKWSHLSAVNLDMVALPFFLWFFSSRCYLSLVLPDLIWTVIQPSPVIQQQEVRYTIASPVIIIFWFTKTAFRPKFKDCTMQLIKLASHDWCLVPVEIKFAVESREVKMKSTWIDPKEAGGRDTCHTFRWWSLSLRV